MNKKFQIEKHGRGRKMLPPCRRCLKICKKCWDNKLTHLRLDPPLSLAKFFYKKGVNDMVVTQKLIYLVYLEILKEKLILLFEERFEAWDGGAILLSVFDTLYENYERLDDFFSKIEDIKDKTVLSYLEKVHNDYLKLGDDWVWEESKNYAWRKARKCLKNEDDVKKIEEKEIISFIQQKNRKII